MGVMAENMKRFTEDLRATTKERKGDLRHIKKATEECLEGARGLIVQIGGAHREMATEQRLALATNREELMNRVAASRDHNREQIAADAGRSEEKPRTGNTHLEKVGHQPPNALQERTAPSCK